MSGNEFLIAGIILYSFDHYTAGMLLIGLGILDGILSIMLRERNR